MLSMKQSAAVILTIGAGNLETVGFPFTLRILRDDRLERSFEGRLPADPNLGAAYDQWEACYRSLGHASLISIPKAQVTNVGRIDDCQAAAAALTAAINHWLKQGNVINALVVRAAQTLSEVKGLKFFIQTSDRVLQRLPWQVWEFLAQTYPDAEVILSSDYRPSLVRLESPVKLLAIEGDTTGTQARLDLTAIAAIPGIQITPLKQPTQKDLRDCLWDHSWDILVFMGHSRSTDRTGEIQLNATETLSLDELHEVLQCSVEKGLQLAIINSCDGVGIAAKLADLKIPYTIAMREAIPDVIAQTFLQTFLKMFSQGKSLHQSVNLARRKLQESQGRFPCASWLPVIYQNPAAPEMRYPKTVTIGRRWKAFLYACLGFLMALVLFMARQTIFPTHSPVSPAIATNQLPPIDQAAIYTSRRSLGEQRLGQYNQVDRLLGEYQEYDYSKNDIETLNAASDAFKQGKYAQAAKQFQAFTQQHERPEIVIYANNAMIRSGKTPAIARIAASVPIGGNNPGTAEEMLRGIAQAQQEQIKLGQPIEVMIVADGNGKDNDGKPLMPIIAPKIIEDGTIKAVIGPNASDAVRDAADLYDKGRLLIVTPTAFFDAFSGAGNHVYRMLPTKNEFTKPLAEHAKKNSTKNEQMIVCEDVRSTDNHAVAESFRESFGRKKVITPDNCIVPIDMPMTTMLTALKASNSRAIFIAPHIEHMADALRLAQAAKRQGLKLLGTSTFFADNMLSDPIAAKSIEGMVFYAPWSPIAADRANQNIFAKRWRTHVTWRTATSYDAFQMVAGGLVAEFRQTGNTTRKELYNFFKQYQTTVSHTGTTGKIQFTEKGDRTNQLSHGELLEIKRVGPGKWQFCAVDRPQECATPGRS
jgi:branched-chain amino acid transport system substrate-binding protein